MDQILTFRFAQDSCPLEDLRDLQLRPAQNNGSDLFLFNRSLIKSKAFVMKIIYSRLVKDSE